ncbi:sumo ligase, putative [Entamoeba dispar SAW760]|uniref:Sumo ligase, putative n=1 Tax=Entamoeba dispar (strain ATCC PRA-260 / SAW760) TaxID=370354 RepID=B0ECF5_ENTDS|nr:sumo ligase, putative [Entamoeba dispar SAW760]EDR27798.1 sumo ligase, putative [Entamoeba dispar SAW760]|eukprot:EDR27798.1 sumo ligase, putative [Entamoeba dispar SAW760]
MTNVIDRLNEIQSELQPYGLTQQNAEHFFEKKIKQMKIKDIEEMGLLLNELFPGFGFEKKKTGINKEGYIKYFSYLIHHPVGSYTDIKQRQFITKHEKSPSNNIIQTDFGHYLQERTFLIEQMLKIPDHLDEQVDKAPKRIDASQEYSGGLNNSNQPNVNRNVSNINVMLHPLYKIQNTQQVQFSPSQLPLEFFETQHPQYMINEIVYCSVFNPSFTTSRFTITTPSSQINNQRIILRLFDLKRNKECNEIYFIQTSVNSTFINLDGFYEPLYGQPHSEPAIVRKPLDITTLCFATKNMVSIMVNKYSPEVIIVACLCSYREVPQLLREVLEGNNRNEAKMIYEMICKKKAPKVSSIEKEVEVIDLDDESCILNEKTEEQEDGEKDDIIVGTNIISLRCPLSFCPITTPIKGVLCKHSTVVNAIGFIEYCLKNNYWNCPLCEKKCYYCSLIVDRSLMEIIKGAPKDCINVEIDTNGKVIKYINDTGSQCENSEDVEVISSD